MEISLFFFSYLEMIHSNLSKTEVVQKSLKKKNLIAQR